MLLEYFSCGVCPSVCGLLRKTFRFIHDVCRGSPFVFAYVDDIGAVRCSAEDCNQYGCLLFKRQGSYGLLLASSSSYNYILWNMSYPRTKSFFLWDNPPRSSQISLCQLHGASCGSTLAYWIFIGVSFLNVPRSCVTMLLVLRRQDAPTTILVYVLSNLVIDVCSNELKTDGATCSCLSEVKTSRSSLWHLPLGAFFICESINAFWYFLAEGTSHITTDASSVGSSECGGWGCRYNNKILIKSLCKRAPQSLLTFLVVSILIFELQIFPSVFETLFFDTLTSLLYRASWYDRKYSLSFLFCTLEISLLKQALWTYELSITIITGT